MCRRVERWKRGCFARFGLVRVNAWRVRPPALSRISILGLTISLLAASAVFLVSLFTGIVYSEQKNEILYLLASLARRDMLGEARQPRKPSSKQKGYLKGLLAGD